ncbi:MAG: carbohydrate ABC transporter substrate-binding protein, partial [Anaerolineales bacterium]|nr:carbohydrate ABC transporter substrate-binding protein [Anaerolineales bacterium]
MNTKKLWSFLTTLLIFSMLLAACAPAATEAPAEEPVAEEPAAEEPAAEEPVAEEPAADTSGYGKVGPELVDAFAGKYSGTVVTMAGPFTDNDAVVFEASIKDFEDKTGIDIQYSGSKEFEASITIAIDGGNPPDIVDFPQPGLLANSVKKGKAIDLSTVINPDWLKENYSNAWLEMGQMEGPDGEITAGIWARANGKSAVWYPKAEFDAAGYEVPETWDELMALTEQIANDGDTPWCIGIESGAATGWAMTDWIEDVMLRTTSL